MPRMPSASGEKTSSMMIRSKGVARAASSAACGVLRLVTSQLAPMNL